MSPRRLTDLPAGALARALFDAVPDGVLVLDADGVVVDASEALCEILGYPRQEIVGRTPPHPWWVDGMLPAAPRFAPAGAREAPAVLVRRDGTTTPATVRWVALGDGLDGERPGSVVVVGRATAAQGLPLGDDGYRSVVEAVREGIVVHARDGTIVSCNPSAERILRLSAGEIIGRDWSHWRPVREDGSPIGARREPHGPRGRHRAAARPTS